MQIRPIGFVFAVCALWQEPAAAQDALAALRGRGEEFCFGRVYEASHLARKKRQALSALFVFKDFSGDPLSEDKPVTREQAIAADKASKVLEVSVLQQDRKGRVNHSTSTCEGAGANTFECPPGSDELAEFNLDLRAAGDKLMAKNGLEAEPYRLDKLPLRTCREWRDRVRPDFVGKGQPLRVRFADRAPVCFAADRDARNPDQKITSVRVSINRPVEIDPSEKIPHTMLRVTVSVKLKDGTAVVRNTRCDSSRYAFWCQYGYGSVWLAPADDRAVTLFDKPNPREPREKAQMEEFFGLALGRGDRAFRLTERDDAACELR